MGDGDPGDRHAGLDEVLKGEGGKEGGRKGGREERKEGGRKRISDLLLFRLRGDRNCDGKAMKNNTTSPLTSMHSGKDRLIARNINPCLRVNTCTDLHEAGLARPLLPHQQHPMAVGEVQVQDVGNSLQLECGEGGRGGGGRWEKRRRINHVYFRHSPCL